MDGVLNIDKPEGMTSHDVVQAIRKMFKTSKVGHLGTLDPIATGVLPVAIGKATRLGQFLPSSPKEYEGELKFGFATDTYDRSGEATSEEKPLSGNIPEAMKALTGIQDQVPPPYSAKKIGGVPAYKFARKNRVIEMVAVRIEIETFEELDFNPPLLKFRVVCSPGTYIRSLVHDLGQRLGCGAHLTALRRTQSGDFRIEHATPLDQISTENLIPLDQLLPSAPRIEIEEADEDKVAHGNPIPGEGRFPLARIFNKRGEFMAIATVENGWVRPRVVLTSTTSR
jgi:tRNA pseudouridine55 synthase